MQLPRVLLCTLYLFCEQYTRSLQTTPQRCTEDMVSAHYDRYIVQHTWSVYTTTSALYSTGGHCTPQPLYWTVHVVSANRSLYFLNVSLHTTTFILHSTRSLHAIALHCTVHDSFLLHNTVVQYNTAGAVRYTRVDKDAKQRIVSCSSRFALMSP